MREGWTPSLPVWRQIGEKAAAGDAAARAEFWSAQRAARYRWLHYETDPVIHTLGRDPSVLPHWVMDLDANCCRVSDGLASEVFEEPFGTPHLYDSERTGLGQALSDRAKTWLELMGGRFVWSPLLKRFVAEPE